MTFADALTQKPLWAALLLGMLLPIIGRHLVLGRTILLGLAVPQISMAGIAFLFLGHALGWAWCGHFADDSSLAAAGALIFAVPALIALATQRAHLTEARLAFLYLASIATTNLMLSSNAVGETYLADLFHGRLLLISDHSLALLAGTLVAGFTIAAALRRRFLLVLTDPDFATVTGISIARWKAVVALLDGAVIGISVATAGPLVTFGFLILPALAAAPFARSLRTHLALSMTLGATIAAAGFWVSYRQDFPLGDSVVATGCALLIACAAIPGLRARSLHFAGRAGILKNL